MALVKVGNIRTSKKDQNPELQRRDLAAAAGCEKIFEERITSRKADRPEHIVPVLLIRPRDSGDCAALGNGITIGFSLIIVRTAWERRGGVNGAAQPLRPSRRQPARRRTLWLLAKHERGRVEVLTAELTGGKKSLPVFSFADEAGLFLRLGAYGGATGGDWRVWETETGELVSILLGPCRGVERVALDPLTGIGAEPVNRLASLDRERFVRFLLGEEAGTRPG
jgi:hypothetical protein